MKTTPMKDGRELIAPEDWSYLNEQDAINCTCACVVSIPGAENFGGAEKYVYFGNTPRDRMTDEHKTRIYAAVDNVMPGFLQFREMELKPIEDDETKARLLVEAVVARLIKEGKEPAATLVASMAKGINPKDMMDHLRDLGLGFDDDMLTALLVDEKDKNMQRHNIFEIYPEGEYPLQGEEPPFGAKIIGAGKEGS